MNQSSGTADQWIKNVTHRMQEDECILNWHWAEGIPCVYIHKSRSDQPLALQELSVKQMKLYTREEYKANTGYRDILEGIGRFTYRIFPCVLEGGRPAWLAQDNGENVIHVNAGKAKIYYEIKVKRNVFSRYKSVQIHIFTEVPISKDVICYVKKQGAYPTNKDDGTQYAFIRDFEPGHNVMPDIQVQKDDCIRIFFTQPQIYGEIYELIPR